MSNQGRELRQSEKMMDEAFQKLRNIDRMVWEGRFNLNEVGEAIALLNVHLNDILEAYKKDRL